MATSTASLVRSDSTTSPVQIRVFLVFSGEIDAANKRSKFNWSAECLNSSGSVYGDGNSWSTSRGGGGDFYINPGTNVPLGSGSFWVQHDGNGYAPSQSITLSVSSSNFYVGSGSVTTSESAPSLANTPSTPAIPSVSEVTARSMKISWTIPANGGAGINQMLLRRYSNAERTGPYVDYPNAGNATSRTVTDLTPGTPYWWAVYARNAVGYSPRSPLLATRTGAGARFWDGTAWRQCQVRQWNGTSWQFVRVRAWDGIAWRNTK